MRRQTAITLRFDSERLPALDALAQSAKTTRPAVLRRLIHERLDGQQQVQLIQAATHAALTDALDRFRAEARSALEQQVKASAASDATSRELITRFIEALAKTLAPAKRA